MNFYTSSTFRLIYIVSMVSDNLALLRVFPKRGAKGMVNISDMMSEVSTDGSLTNVR